MEHGARLSTQRVIAIGFIAMGVVILGSITTNVIQAVNNYRLQNEQKSIVTPMLFNAPFAVSQNQADASYLQQMALSLIALRLNVTPETVDASHEQLLSYVKPAAQNELKIRLAEDAKRIKDNNVNSSFYMTSVKVYTRDGVYGSYFNSDEPSLKDEARMVVLELGGLEDRPSLLVAVMFSLILYIENRMYRTPRSLKKLNVIDEGWRLLDFKNNKVGAFIEKGYRTARRHTGSYITITQNIVDFDSETASSAARAAWGNSSYKIILKQSAKEFAKYNQLYPDQYSQLQRDMIKGFGSAKDNWFSSFMLSVEHLTSWHRLFVDPLSRAMYSSDGPDFEFLQQRRREGLSIHEAVWELAWKKSGPEMAALERWLHEHEGKTIS